MPFNNFLRYSKSFERGGINKDIQEKLLGAKVLVMGAGALGSGVIMTLSAMGIGHIKIIDGSTVKEEDFNCQIIHKYKNIGRAKVMSAKDWVGEFNPDVKVEIEKINIDEKNCFNAIEGYNIIVDCFDDYETKYMLNEIALKYKKILIHAGVMGFCGQVTTIVPNKTGCLSCVLQKPKVFKNETFASISPVINTIASIQAQEVLKIVTGLSNPLLNKLLLYDSLKSEFKILNYSKNIACEQCGGN